MTDEVEVLIRDFFHNPINISIAVSGTRLDNIEQQCYSTQNFNTKVNLLSFLLEEKEEFSKVLVFMSSKKYADKLFESLEEKYGSQMAIIHSNKSQNYRIRSLQKFSDGEKRILISTDVMARGIDIDDITHVINFDTPSFPENYMHRIARTGRAEKKGKSILFHTEEETSFRDSLELLMKYELPVVDFPEQVSVSSELIGDEVPKSVDGASVKSCKITEKRLFLKKN